jgi:hypothetical protein
MRSLLVPWTGGCCFPLDQYRAFDPWYNYLPSFEAKQSSNLRHPAAAYYESSLRHPAAAYYESSLRHPAAASFEQHASRTLGGLGAFNSADFAP